MEVNNILTADLLDLIFENRNKNYGAYNLRKTYKKRLTTALVCTAVVALLALFGSFSGIAKKHSSKIQAKEYALEDIKQDEPEKIETPPPPPPPRCRRSGVPE